MPLCLVFDLSLVNILSTNRFKKFEENTKNNMSGKEWKEALRQRYAINPTFLLVPVVNRYTKGKGKDAASDAESVDSMLMDLDNDDDDFENPPPKKTSRATTSKAKAPAKKAPARGKGKKVAVRLIYGGY